MRKILILLVLAAGLSIGLAAQSYTQPTTASRSAASSRATSAGGATSATASRPEEWLPLVHNSVQPPPDIKPIKLPPLAPQEGDGQAELIHRAALAWFEAAIADVDKLIPAAEAAADAIIAGGDFYVSGSDGFMQECNGRAGGFAFTKIWDGKHLNAGDVLMIGQLNPTQEGPLNAGLSNVIRGDGSVSTGRVVHIASHNWRLVRELAPHLNNERWEGRLAMIDTHAPDGASFQEIAIGQMATCAIGWAFQGEVFAAGTRKGKTLVTFASLGEPYGKEWFEYFKGQKIHTRFNVPPIPPGKIARDYLLTCQAQLAQFFENKQGGQYRQAAARMEKVLGSGGTVWMASGSHVLTSGAIVPREFGGLVILGKSYDWRIEYLKKGDLLLRPGGGSIASVEAVVSAGGEVVTLSPYDPVTNEHWTHIRTANVQGDSSINVPDYPVRILPTSGVNQVVQWYCLLAETQKLFKPAATSRPGK